MDFIWLPEIFQALFPPFQGTYSGASLPVLWNWSLSTEFSNSDLHTLLSLHLQERKEFLSMANFAIWGGALSVALLVSAVMTQIQRGKRYNQLLIEQLRSRTEKIIAEQKLMRRQHKVIVEKSRQLQSSLEYARYIQTSLLPDERKLKEYYPNSFAILEAKDVVSGDFFWITEKYDTTYLAVIDCTGHGVPGAFMSIIARNLLDEAIHARGVLNTSNILDEMRKSMTRTLCTNSHDQISNGLDITLCSYNRHSQILTFSGGNQSLYLIRKNSSALENMRGMTYNPYHIEKDLRLFIFPGDRQPIGRHHGPEKPFTCHTAKILPGDRIYAFSDGFRDQFGGPDHKKLKASRFRNLLLDVQRYTMSGQSEKLMNRFNLWKGANEQNDDVCIVGVEF